MTYPSPKPEWLNQTWGRPPEGWAGAQREVRAYLIATARKRSVATYQELQSVISATNIPATGSSFGYAIGLLLGQVNLLESEAIGKPMMLSAVAVNLDLHPGPGFQGMLGELGWKGDWPTWLTTVWRYYAG
jgi:hypothetical protein